MTSHPPSVTPDVSVPLGSLGEGLGPPHGLTGNAGSVKCTLPKAEAGRANWCCDSGSYGWKGQRCTRSWIYPPSPTELCRKPFQVKGLVLALLLSVWRLKYEAVLLTAQSAIKYINHTHMLLRGQPLESDRLLPDLKYTTYQTDNLGKVIKPPCPQFSSSTKWG